MPGGPERADAISGFGGVELLTLWYRGDIGGGVLDVGDGDWFYVLGWWGEGVEEGGIFFDDAEPGFVIGREYLHGFPGAVGNCSRLHNNLVVIQIKLHLFIVITKLFQNFDIASQFIDFVFKIREDVGCIIRFYEFGDAGYDILPLLRRYEHERNSKFFKLLLH